MDQDKRSDENVSVCVSVVVTTFNSPDYLSATLASLTYQNTKSFEVVIADDGSSCNVRAIIETYKTKLDIVHSWQPDRGFRAARARNLAVLRARGRYVVFIDGDCLVPPWFVANYVRLFESNVLVSGGRKLGSETFTNELLLANSWGGTSKAFSHWKFWSMPLGFVRTLKAKSWKSVRSANMGMERQLFLEIGGFDEVYIGWGLEDSDFVVRAINHGCKIKSGRFAVSVFHLFHKEAERKRLSDNYENFKRVLSDKEVICAVKSVLN